MYDNICKFIAEKFSRDLASWLLGNPIELTVLEPTELQVDPIRVDSVIFLQSEDIILHIEFQTDPKDDIPFRMTDYRLRLHRRFLQQQVYQVVIYLRQTRSPLAWTTSFDLPQLHHEYRVIRLWEVPTEELMVSSGLLPFAVLSQTDNRINVLQQVARRIEGMSNISERNDIAATTAVLSGLVLDRMIVRQLLKEEIMKESVIYQDIREEGEIIGGQKEASKLILRQLKRRFGEISQNLTIKIQELSVGQLEDLAEALLDFTNVDDLRLWLSNQQN